jgi:ribosomal protein S18 acetylase RimI-like enzyme
MSEPIEEANTIVFREAVRHSDMEAVRAIVESTNMFRPAEVEVAVELVRERLRQGELSGYYFVFAESRGEVVGYACYGPIACTVASHDLFWIAVHRDCQGRGLGRQLLAESESLIRQAGGQRVYAETSGRADYASTRAYYERCGYRCEAVIESFYAPGDDKCIYVKVLKEED